LGRRFRRWIFSSVNVCAVQKGAKRNAVREDDPDVEELCEGEPMASFGDTEEGDEVMEKGSELGVDKMVMYRSRR